MQQQYKFMDFSQFEQADQSTFQGIFGHINFEPQAR
jgi:hypothetical protein